MLPLDLTNLIFAFRQDIKLARTLILRSLHRYLPKWRLESPQLYRSSIRFPPNDFKHYFTLFPKFFSSFPHGTCSLSVSRLYLALDEVYHPIWAALPSNSTRPRRAFKIQTQNSYTGLSPSLAFRSRKLEIRLYFARASPDYIFTNDTCEL